MRTAPMDRMRSLRGSRPLASRSKTTAGWLQKSRSRQVSRFIRMAACAPARRRGGSGSGTCRSQAIAVAQQLLQIGRLAQRFTQDAPVQGIERARLDPVGRGLAGMDLRLMPPQAQQLQVAVGFDI